jgi:hypothetical protein
VKLRGTWKLYFQDIDIVVWVLDSTSSINIYKKRFVIRQSISLKVWLTNIGAQRSRFQESVDAFYKMIKDPLLEYTPICILANKQDMPDAIKKEEVIEVRLLPIYSNRTSFSN